MFSRYVARFSAEYLKVILSLVPAPIWKIPSNLVTGPFLVFLGLHSFTECDSTNAMKGNGKQRPLGIHQKSPEYEEVSSQLGDTWPVSEDIVTNLEAFYVLCMAK